MLETLKPERLITPGYKALQEQLHSTGEYGERGYKWAKTAKWIVDRYDIRSVLDYGCGQGTFKSELRSLVTSAVRIDEYDPAIPNKSQRPGFADLVVCTDVLEHVEPFALSSVIGHIHALARVAVLFVVATVDTEHIMSDGRSTHLTIQPSEYWERTIKDAGFYLRAIDDLPVPLSPEKREKCWIGVAIPC